MDFAASVHAYPIVLATHLSCIALFGGLILMTNLRLLGWALTDYSVSDLVEKLRVWKTAGFVIMAGCGLLLAGSEARKVLRQLLLLGQDARCWGSSGYTLWSFAASIEAWRNATAPQ